MLRVFEPILQKSLNDVWRTNVALWESVIKKRIHVQRMRFELKLNSMLNEQVITIFYNICLQCPTCVFENLNFYSRYNKAIVYHACMLLFAVFSNSTHYIICWHSCDIWMIGHLLKMITPRL